MTDLQDPNLAQGEVLQRAPAPPEPPVGDYLQTPASGEGRRRGLLYTAGAVVLAGTVTLVAVAVAKGGGEARTDGGTTPSSLGLPGPGPEVSNGIDPTRTHDGYIVEYALNPSSAAVGGERLEGSRATPGVEPSGPQFAPLPAFWKETSLPAMEKAIDSKQPIATTAGQCLVYSSNHLNASNEPYIKYTYDTNPFRYQSQGAESYMIIENSNGSWGMSKAVSPAPTFDAVLNGGFEEVVRVKKFSANGASGDTMVTVQGALKYTVDHRDEGAPPYKGDLKAANPKILLKDMGALVTGPDGKQFVAGARAIVISRDGKEFTQEQHQANCNQFVAETGL